MISNFAKTKILATIGPATDSKEGLKKLIEAGVDGLRLNFSHGNYEYFENLFTSIYDVCNEKKLPIPILVDLQGPKIRIGKLEKDEIYLDTYDTIEITTDEIIGTQEIISTSYSELLNEVNIGETILIDDGLIELEVISIGEKSIECRIVKGGVLKQKKGMNLPGSNLKVPSLTEKDYADLEFAFKHRVDFVALSFVRKADDILTLRSWMKENKKDSFIIAKIEKPEAVRNFDAILKVSDGIMVARGDLGVEMKANEVPVIQKQIIKKCKAAGKLVITATQMFESMVKNPVPTRAEATDVANAVWDGTDVVMLSAETSVGNYPFDAVKIMNDILVSTEEHTDYYNPVKYEIPEELADNIFDSNGRAVSEIANQINATLIVVFTHKGRKAKVISKFDTKAPIIAMSDNFTTLNQLNLFSGIYPIYNDNFDVEENAIQGAMEILHQKNLIQTNDLILFTSGAPITDVSRRNWMRFVIV